MMDAARQADEARGLAIMREAGATLVDGVRTSIPQWAVRVVTQRYTEWTHDVAPAALIDQARAAGLAAAPRVAAHLDALLALDPEAQAATPLEIVRTAVREPTEVLRTVGVPEVVRDEFAERAWPHDVYGLVPH